MEKHRNQNQSVDLSRIYYQNSCQQIDWHYYTKFYPEKLDAIRKLRLDTGMSLKDAKAIVEEIFDRIESGQVTPTETGLEEQPPKETHLRREAPKQDHSGCCLMALFAILYVLLSSIFKLAGSYSKHRR